MDTYNYARFVRLNKEARTEVRAAAKNYEQVRPGHGAEFIEELEEKLANIAQNPASYERINDKYRRVFLKQFPIVVVYRLQFTGVEVVGVIPQRDEPRIAKRIAVD